MGLGWEVEKGWKVENGWEVEKCWEVEKGRAGCAGFLGRQVGVGQQVAEVPEK